MEVEVEIDSYLIVTTRSPRFRCLPDTIVDESSSLQILYLRLERPPEVQHLIINGSDFHPGLAGVQAFCIFYDEDEATLSVPVDYQQALHPNQVHCLVDGSPDVLGSLLPGTTYSLRYQ